jgi:TM2 domain-containing membrane protein YozV
MSKSKSKLTTLILLLILGFFGIHRFYTGYIWLGILYLFTGGILGIGIAVDLAFIICDQYEDKNGNILK